MAHPVEEVLLRELEVRLIPCAAAVRGIETLKSNGADHAAPATPIVSYTPHLLSYCLDSGWCGSRARSGACVEAPRSQPRPPGRRTARPGSRGDQSPPD